MAKYQVYIGDELDDNVFDSLNVEMWIFNGAIARGLKWEEK